MNEEVIIDTKGVKVNFGNFWALKGIDITVKKGEIIVILGPSGSGKSTFIRTLNRLQPHSGGTIVVDGITIDEETSVADLKHIRSEVGFVFQQFELFPHLTVIENITLAPMKVNRMSKRDAEQKAMELLERVGIPEQAYKYPSGLSGGQQQRVGIARSLAVEPDIWFLDEPFSALDPLIRKEMQDEFLRLQDSLHKTIMFVTHDFDEALRLADRIAIMKDGIIEQLDTPDNIVLNPATEYVKKFTEDVPREKVLKIESIMDKYDEASTVKKSISKDAIIETVAESILESKENLLVVDANLNNKPVGILKPSKVIKVLFGK